VSATYIQQLSIDADQIDQTLDRMRLRRELRMRELDAHYGAGYARQQLIRAEAARVRLRAPRAQASPEQLATVARYLETIVAASHTDKDGKVHVTRLTERAISLVDQMQREKLIPFELHRAGQYFCDLFWIASGRSVGVSTYGDFIKASEPSTRMITSDRQMQAYDQFKQAAFAAFGVPRQDGRLGFDEELFKLVMPALLSDRKSVTKQSIGTKRSEYKGHGQRQAIGAAIITEVLHRLCLHWGYRNT